MNEWTEGYRRALSDIEHLANRRRIMTTTLAELLGDLVGDALVIEREQDNRLRRRRLAVVREALPLFAAVCTTAEDAP